MIENAQGFVLAGGQSRRMGRDKASILFRGQPLISHALRIFDEAGLKSAILGSRPDLATHAPVIEDRVAGMGPLAGVCAALEQMECRWGVFLPVDVPLLPASLLKYLLSHAQTTGSAVTMASLAGHPQTFPAVLDKAALPALRAELEADQRRCMGAFAAAAAALGQTVAVLPVELLAQAGQVEHPAALPPALWFVNVNTPEELRRAESLAVS